MIGSGNTPLSDTHAVLNANFLAEQTLPLNMLPDLLLCPPYPALLPSALRPGMTEDGNHGGASAEEITAGLFLYARRGLASTVAAHARDGELEGGGELDMPLPTLDIDGALRIHHEDSDDPASPLSSARRRAEAQLSSKQAARHARVHQVSIVPTLSLLLGVPIPFANLGGVIPGLSYTPYELLDRLSPAEQRHADAVHAAHAAWQNGAQIHRYLQSYHQLSQSFPEAKRRHLNNMFAAANASMADAVAGLRGAAEVGGHEEEAALAELLQATRTMHAFMSAAASQCRELWTQFDLPSMAWGVVLLVLSSALALGLSAGRDRLTVHGPYGMPQNGQPVGPPLIPGDKIKSLETILADSAKHVAADAVIPVALQRVMVHVYRQGIRMGRGVWLGLLGGIIAATLLEPQAVATVVARAADTIHQPLGTSVLPPSVLEALQAGDRGTSLFALLDTLMGTQLRHTAVATALSGASASLGSLVQYSADDSNPPTILQALWSAPPAGALLGLGVAVGCGQALRKHILDSSRHVTSSSSFMSSGLQTVATVLQHPLLWFLVIRGDSLMSNSFMDHEHTVVTYLASGAVLALCRLGLQGHKRSKWGWWPVALALVSLGSGRILSEYQGWGQEIQTTTAFGTYMVPADLRFLFLTIRNHNID